MSPAISSNFMNRRALYLINLELLPGYILMLKIRKIDELRHLCVKKNKRDRK